MLYCESEKKTFIQSGKRLINFYFFYLYIIYIYFLIFIIKYIIQFTRIRNINKNFLKTTLT